MEIDNIKINCYIFKKEDNEWICKNNNLMTGDIKWINKIMPKLKEIEEIIKWK